MIDHEYGDWDVTKEATCTEAGSKYRECAVCHLVETESIPAKGHTLVAVDGKDATSSEPGYEAYWKCSECEKLFSDAAGKNEISEPTVIDPTGPTPVDPQPTPIITPTTPTASAEITDLPAVKISKPAAAKKAATVKWKKITKKNLKKIQGIEIQVATDPGFNDIAKTATAGKKKTSKKIKGLTSKQTYYVRIRAYSNLADGKHVSVWKTKKVKIK